MLLHLDPVDQEPYGVWVCDGVWPEEFYPGGEMCVERQYAEEVLSADAWVVQVERLAFSSPYFAWWETVPRRDGESADEAFHRITALCGDGALAPWRRVRCHDGPMGFAGRVRYDRRVHEDFLAHFLPGGVARSLTEYAQKARFPVDLQMRHSPKNGVDHATLYVGLTSVLNVTVKAKGLALALSAHPTWSEGRYGFDKAWRDAAPVADWASRWPDVEEYLEKVIPSASVTHGRTEGAVQAAASAFSDGSRVMLDREVVPHFRELGVKKSVLGPLSAELANALSQSKPVPGKPPASFGAECDLLALDKDGRLLAVEVKPSVSSLVWTPAQATMYARVLRAWVDDDKDGEPGWSAVVLGMLDQRRRLGLVPDFPVTLPKAPVVVPVIAVQRGASPELLRRLWKVQQALIEAGVGDPSLELYEVSLSGRLDRIRP